MKSILNQFADRLADKEKLEFPKYNSLAGGNPIENRWNQLEEVIEVMELEIAINAVFMNQKMMRSTLTRTGSPSQAHIYPIFAQSHLKQVYRKLSESVYFSA